MNKFDKIQKQNANLPLIEKKDKQVKYIKYKKTFS